MPLLPFRAAPPAQPPSPLSQAREALRRHGEAWQRQRQRLDDLAAPVRAADQAVAKEAEAQQQLDAIAELEEARLRRWTDSPAGMIPAPLAVEREQAMWRLSETHAAAVLALRHARYVEPDCRAAEQ